MNLAHRPTQFLRRFAQRLKHVGRQNEDLAIAAALPAVIMQLHDPVAFVAFLRNSWQPTKCQVAPVRTGPVSARFSTLLSVLRSSVPPLDARTAVEIGLVADGFRARHDERPSGRFTEVAQHFAASSSSSEKGRILSAAVCFMRSEAGLEIGTAYGMSALFIAAAQSSLGREVNLVTIEGSEPQYSLAKTMLAGRFPTVVCEKGLSRETLPRLQHRSDIDFVFHDGGHSRDHYVGDFALLKGLLCPGAIVLFDDIRWKDRWRPGEDPRTYEGWREVVADPSVAHAVEIDGRLGLLLIK
jgi:predicted O-methyltransferase YrrM